VAVILWWMSISDTLIDILDVPPREVRSDEAQSFATYKNYLLSLSKFILAHYGDEPACFASMHSRCSDDKLETPARNQKLTSGDEAAIRKSLFNCWHTELVLRLPTKTPDLIRYANHWSPVQAYYAIYLCLRAYLRSSGDGVADTHATTLKTISFQLEQRKLLLPFWNVVCSGGSGDASLKDVEYRNLPSGIRVRAISSLSNPRVQDFWHWLAMMLRTTRSRHLKLRLEDKNTRKKFATKTGTPRQSYSAAQRKEVCASIPATSIFDFLLISSRATSSPGCSSNMARTRND